MNVSVRKKGFSAFPTVKRYQLAEVLEDRPELQTIPTHKPRGFGNFINVAEAKKLIENEQTLTATQFTTGEFSCHCFDSTTDEQAKKTAMLTEIVGRKNQKHRGTIALEVREFETGRGQSFRHAATV